MKSEVMDSTIIHTTKRTLPGGIHPPAHKAMSLREALAPAPLPDRLVIPLGSGDAEVLVRAGQPVRKGQLLARGAGPLGMPVHASSSGEVRGITEHPVPGPAALPEPCVLIDTDGEERWREREPVTDFRARDPRALLGIIANAGISGLGGAGFPAHVKLARARAVDTLIINACECEPFITADDRLMRDRAADIVAGLHILLHILRPRRCLVGIEDDKPEALAALRTALEADGDERIALTVVPARYPSGSERQLIWLLTGTALPHGRLPADHGIVCHNVGTVHAVARAVRDDQPLLSRVTTLTGAALARPGNLEVLIGTPIEGLLEQRGLDRDRLSRLIMGGSLMGTALPGLNLPVVKTTNCLIATAEEELPSPPPARPCIRCGLCVDACPAGLLPQQLYWFARSKEHGKAREHNLFDCIECGACAYACPSHIPLVQYYRATKARIREEDAMHARAEHARKRFEFHQQRVERDKAREEARRKERARLARDKASGKAGAKDAIQAALARVQKKKQARRKPDDDQGGNTA